MHPAEIIARKRDGGSHSPEEIAALVRGFTAGEVHDYQMSAWTMAVYLRGLNVEETLALTEAMLRSGEVLTGDGSSIRVDKHSTGGMGDKSSFIVAPLIGLLRVARADDFGPRTEAPPAARSTSWNPSPACAPTFRSTRFARSLIASVA